MSTDNNALDSFESMGLPVPDAMDLLDDLESAESPATFFTEDESSRTMPHPVTGKMTRFTRASKFAGTISDEYTLTEWKIAMSVFGVTHNDAMTELARSIPRPEDNPKGWWKPLAEIGHKGMDMADASEGAHRGTSVHNYREQVERGVVKLEEIRETYRAHVSASMELHRNHGFESVPELVERLVLNIDLHNGVCGRIDGLKMCPDGTLIVDDLKTGKDAPMGLDEIAIQLAIYANATHMFNESDGTWSPMPENVRKDMALVTWTPIDRPAESELIPVDIEWGWAAAKVAAWVRAYRNRSKRKHNSLRLPVQSLADTQYNTDAPEEYWVQRIITCTDQYALINLVMGGAASNGWTTKCGELATARYDYLIDGA